MGSHNPAEFLFSPVSPNSNWFLQTAAQSCDVIFGGRIRAITGDAIVMVFIPESESVFA